MKTRQGRLSGLPLALFLTSLITSVLSLATLKQ